jgi:hypothetical protein
MEDYEGVLPSVRAQDIAEAQGVAYKDLAANQQAQADQESTPYDPGQVSQAINSNIEFKAPSSYIDQATGTVAGQLQSLLASDSPYIKQAEEKAKDQAGSRGLLNTTMAARAGQKAAIETALPIAQQDATTFSQFQQAKQAADYNQQTIQGEGIVSSFLVDQKASIERKNQAIQNAFNASLAGAGEDSKIFLTDLQNSYNLNIQNLENLSKQTLLEMELTSDQARAISDAAAGIVQNYQISVENMLTDPDFLNMGAKAVNNAINQIQVLATNSIKFIGASQGINLDAFVDTYFSDLKVL